MTVRLTVRRDAWEAHVGEVANAYGHPLVPVVKGNGYGFGRALLHDLVVAAGAPMVAIGNVHELDDVPSSLRPVVLTPTLTAPRRHDAVLTVGTIAHVEALADWSGQVMVKLVSSMRRYGVTPAQLSTLLDHVDRAGLGVEAFSLHLPLAGDDADRIEEVEAWLPHLPSEASLWVSHLEPASVHELQRRHPSRDLRVRVGTRLWLGAPRGDFVQLSADVLQVQPVAQGQPVGYRLRPSPFDGSVVSIGAGVVNGVAPLDDAAPGHDSPFHFARTRLALLERPHMHTSLVVVPNGRPCPNVGDRVDVQRPFITTTVDEIEWE